MEELEEVIRTTKKNKAPGLSGITYDFWKHSKSLMRILLLEIINEKNVNKKKKEAWILLMDILKAFDSVSTTMFEIFYDALLTRLEQIKDKVRYKIEENKIININKREKEKLELNFNMTAFMDDTTLISKNKEANIGKYELIKISNNQDNLVIEGEEVKKVNSYKACQIFNWKKLNEKQIIATWNMVIIPHIKYQLQAIFLVKPECEFIIERINGLIENLSKNLIYQANGNEKLKLLFDSKTKKDLNYELHRRSRYNSNTRIEYLTQHIFITPNICNEFNRIIRLIYRYSLSLPKSLFNSVIHNPIYPYILNIWDSQLWMQASLLNTQINNPITSHFIQFLILTSQNHLWTNDISETDNNPLLIAHQTTIQEFKEGINSIQLY
ncbi:hypothetical protein GLOIN_2v1780713 [Rhizophagus irregularis DAOM 181602=DAOM 197198]|nr:hypothetical protein GLOIN_2v1780713 [Rhizophagus irregularis DAOM 181602=DAOM 197198]